MWEEFSQAYAFMGNSLLKPMTQTEKAGLNPEFWRAFPDFGDEGVRGALEDLARFAEGALDEAMLTAVDGIVADAAAFGEASIDEAVFDGGSMRADAGALRCGANAPCDDAGIQATLDEAALRVSVEYTRLFVGPPSPAAPPWETMNRREGATVGFGEPTFRMRKLLREAGLELSNENRQYEDHMGIELLYLSELCRRCAQGGEEDGRVKESEWVDQALSFIGEHPAAWIDSFREKVHAAVPGGYFDNLLALARAVLVWQCDCLRR